MVLPEWRAGGAVVWLRQNTTGVKRRKGSAGVYSQNDHKLAHKNRAVIEADSSKSRG